MSGLHHGIGEEGGDLSFGRHTAGRDHLFINNKTRRGQDLVLHDLGVVGNLLDLRLDGQVVDRLLGAGGQVLAVRAAGSEYFYGEHIRSSFYVWNFFDHAATSISGSMMISDL